MKRFLNFLGIDRAITYTLIGRGWSVLSGLVTLVFISRYLAPVEQGFYYTFASVLALQVVFELGMSHVVMQFASHEMAHLIQTSDGILRGDESAKSRLRSLLILVMKWYGAISLLIVLGLLPAGKIFFAANDHDVNVTWQGAWVWLVFAAALNILITPIFALLEGCGKVAEIARMRVIQGVVGSIVAWIAFAGGGGLLAMPAMNTVMAIIALLWLWYEYLAFFKDLLSASLSEIHINWKAEIWPFQWRVGVSWLSGYFMLQLFVPVLFSYRGAIEAGQMGMSLSIATALTSIATAWVNTKAPIFGGLVALRRYRELDFLFFKVLRQSIIVALLGCCAALLGKLILMYLGTQLNNRILPTLPFSLLLLTVIINNIVFAESIYLRAYREEGFMWVYVLLGLSISITTFFVGRNFGVVGMMACYCVISLVVGLGLGSWIFQRKRLEQQGIKYKTSVE